MSFLMNIYRYVVDLIHTTFDGTNEDISADGVVTSCSANTVGSWSFWFNADNYSSGTQSLIGFSKSTTVDNILRIWFSSGVLKVEGVTTSTQWQFNPTTAYSWSNGTWYHIAATHNGTTTKLYINGSSESITFTTSIDKTIWNSSISANRFTIGALDFNNTTGQYFDGKIDKIIVYDKELTSGEVTTIYNYGRKPGLIGIGNEVSQWEMDALNPTDVIENPFTLLDGVNEYTAITDDSTLRGMASLTVSCWIKKGTKDVKPVGYDSKYLLRETSGVLYFYIITGSLGGGSFSFPALDTNWHHIVGTYDGATVKMYLDGVISATTHSKTGNISNTSTTQVILGAEYNTTNPMDGGISNVFIGNAALNQAEVTAMYNQGRNITDYSAISGAITHLKMDALNPTDEIGSNNGSSVNQDATNIDDEINNGTSVNMDSSNIVVG